MMETAPTTDAVYQGVYALHNNPDKAEKEKASKWLELLQKSIYSWSIADELLQQKRDLHSCYFAAQTMRNKIQTSFHELPPCSHESLRDSLIAHISQITPETDPLIVTQLCLALADLALLMSSWQNSILELIEKLSGNPNSIWPLIVILTLLPEEMNSRYLRLGANRREEIQLQLESNARTVSELLHACLTNCQDDPKMILKVIKCFTSWTSAQAIPICDISNNLIVGQCFNLLRNQETNSQLHDAASDCLCTLLQCIESYQHQQQLAATVTSSRSRIISDDNDEQSSDTTTTATRPQTTQSMINNVNQLEIDLFNSILQLENAYHMSVGLEDTDKAMNYCRIFTILGETFLVKIVSISEPAPHYAIKALDLVLNCVGHYDYEVAEITFNLWYRLSEELFEKQDYVLTSHFRPYIERLIGALYRHSQFDADYEGLMDDGEMFSDFRKKVSDLIKDVVFIVGSSTCFKQMFIMLQEPSVTWESSEAALFVMENVAKNILPEENEVIPKVAEAILNLPENTHIAVRYTSIMLLGELCEWIDANPESLQAVLNFLLFSLQQKNGLAAAAATALKSICSTCDKKMVCHLNGLIQIAASLDSFNISNDAAIGLLKGISMITSQLPIDQLTPTMKEICAFQLQPLQSLIDTNVKIEPHQRNDPTFWLDRLTAIIRHTNPDIRDGEIHPCSAIITDAWPIISNILSKYQTDSRVMERTCRCIRYTMRSIGKQGAPLLESLVKQIVHLYELHQHSCFLYLGSILVDEFAMVSDQCTQGLLNMLQAFIEPTFNILQMENGLKNHPDTVDDFFRLCSRFIQRCPVAFLQSPIVPPIMQCALLACTLDHRDANLSVMQFFFNLLSCGKNETNDLKRRLVYQLVQLNGEALVINLIHASVYYLHSYMLSDVADVILELKAIDHEHTDLYLKKALDALPKKNSGGCVTATQNQLDEFHMAVIKSESSKAVTHALKDFTRLYR